MRLGSFKYLIKQGWKGMGANRLMTLASIGVLTACLIITGVATLLSMNINRIIDYLGSKNEIIAYILDDTPAEQVEGLKAQIEGMPNVQEVRYVSKAEAFEELQEMLAEYAGLLTGLEDVPPSSFRVTVEDLNFMAETERQIAVLPGLDDTQTRLDLADAMLTVKNAANYGGWALVVVLGFVSIIVISNTIRLTVFARRREISIMKYVGATNSFIRMPFFVEGMTVGIVAGLLASGIVCGAYHLVYEYVTGSISLWDRGMMQSLIPLQQLWYLVVGGFTVFGAVIGGIGTASSIRKHLKV